MNLRYGWCLVCVLTLASVPANADDETLKKLDAILEKLDALSERVDRIEQQVQALTKERVESKRIGHTSSNVQPLPGLQRPMRMQQPLPRRPVTPAGVIQMQGESSGRLLDGLHQRERELRRRTFMPELFDPPIYRISP